MRRSRRTSSGSLKDADASAARHTCLSLVGNGESSTHAREARLPGYGIGGLCIRGVDLGNRHQAHHTDPFDRLLLAQAFTEPLRLVTADRALAVYGGAV